MYFDIKASCSFCGREDRQKALKYSVSQVMIRTKIQGRLRGQNNRGASLHRSVSLMRRHLNRDRKEVQKLSAALLRRGYSWEDIRAAFQKFDCSD